MYTRPAAAERKAWSRFIFVSEVGPKEPLSASLTPHSNYATFASTPMIWAPLHLRLTFWLSLNDAVMMGTGPSSSVSVDNPLGRVNALKVDIKCRASFWCPWLNIGTHHTTLHLSEWISGSMNEGDVYAPGKNLICTQIWDSDTGFCISTAGNVPLRGISGSLAKRKIARLRENGCFACGSVPRNDDKDPYMIGGLALNYVKHVACSFIPRDTICKPTTWCTVNDDPRHHLIRRFGSSLN